ncbi:hypothetical protein [Sphingomonas sp. 1F27F7B]|jgi:hypothetical protein|uniref:hypothetical protein n=1 Tax=Sphingomonas sp. 1F27F7B TaxID=2502186 RepID=UPI000AFF6C8E|nr:hypothetical protein [Sphingomonas sp. 1F27F7B]
MDGKTLTRIWNQHEIPVILRRTGKGEFLRVRLPYADTNRAWLQAGRRILPAWTSAKRYWEIPKTWFCDTSTEEMNRLRVEGGAQLAAAKAELVQIDRKLIEQPPLGRVAVRDGGRATRGCQGRLDESTEP